ncbi:MAG: DUF2147 domain-containing protein [Flavobacteriales bacterium]
MMHRRLLFLLPLLLPFALSAQVTGRWVTIDDETGKKKSVVEITEVNGTLSGKIIKLFREPSEEQDPVCKECDPKDDRFNKKVIGMEIIRGMKQDGDEWEDGTILDPKNGSVYDCKLWLEDGQLQVRGYVAFFFRTQTWVRE